MRPQVPDLRFEVGKGEEAMKILHTIVIVVLMLSPTVAARAVTCVGIPDLDFSVVTKVYEGLCSLVITPEGSGPPMTEARTPTGDIVDATIHLTLINNCPEPGGVASFPAEDMWLESLDGGVSFCQGGSTADGPTDGDGHTQWSAALSGGGWDESNCRVVVNGLPLGPSTGLNLRFNSPDSNGDREVNLLDISAFAQDFFGDYHYRADLFFDGTVNLADVSVLALALGESCP
jgi:hypothetical protein